MPPSTTLIGRPIGVMISLVGSTLSEWQIEASRSGTVTGWSLTSHAVGVGRADDLAALDAAAGQGDVEDLGEVVAAGVGVDLGRAAELAHPDDQRAVEHAVALQVGIRVANAGSTWLASLPTLSWFCWWVSQPLERTSTKVTPAWTSRRASRQPWPNGVRP